MYREKLPNGKYRYYYKQPELKNKQNKNFSTLMTNKESPFKEGPRAKYGTYRSSDGKHTVEYKTGKYSNTGVYYGGSKKNSTWSHTVITESESDRKRELKKAKLKRNIEKGKKKIANLFKKRYKNRKE